MKSRRWVSGLFGAAAVAVMLAQGARFDTVKQCPEVCKGLDSGDWSYWFLGCWEFGNACSAAVGAMPSPVQPVFLMSRLRVR
jgi:hypothetical protein